ncbi:MAG: hypothetical protein HPY62_10345, partial [Bacteroidales bacterium]|nr:hypothetical protein [Bacteroidales bacterium]
MHLIVFRRAVYFEKLMNPSPLTGIVPVPACNPYSVISPVAPSNLPVPPSIV